MLHHISTHYFVLNLKLNLFYFQYWIYISSVDHLVELPKNILTCYISLAPIHKQNLNSARGLVSPSKAQIKRDQVGPKNLENININHIFDLLQRQFQSNWTMDSGTENFTFDFTFPASKCFFVYYIQMKGFSCR